MKSRSDKGSIITRPGIEDIGKFLVEIEDKEGIDPEHGLLTNRVHVPAEKIERAISFWKPIYFSEKRDGRFLNGAEAYDLGDPAKTPNPNKAPYIAMCNLMALEGLKMIGDYNVTVEDAEHMMFGNEREREIADFWKNVFSPTLFQSQWSLKAMIAVMSGEPYATADLLDRYQDQLP